MNRTKGIIYTSVAIAVIVTAVALSMRSDEPSSERKEAWTERQGKVSEQLSNLQKDQDWISLLRKHNLHSLEGSGRTGGRGWHSLRFRKERIYGQFPVATAKDALVVIQSEIVAFQAGFFESQQLLTEDNGIVLSPSSAVMTGPEGWWEVMAIWETRKMDEREVPVLKVIFEMMLVPIVEIEKSQQADATKG